MDYQGYPQNVLDEIEQLKQKILESRIPAKVVGKNMLVGTWNIRNFARISPTWGEPTTSPKRNLRSLAYIAEIVQHFDVLAVQEVREDTSGIRALVNDFLGEDWGLLLSDISIGSTGNSERLAYIFDKRRVQPSGLAGEIAFPRSEYGDPSELFERPPYIVGFQFGRLSFALLTAHIRYGTMPEDRFKEIKVLADMVSIELRDRVRAGSDEKNLLILGDFNIDLRGENPMLVAFVSHGLFVPDQQRNITTVSRSKARTKFYDQIGWFMGEGQLEFQNSGAIDFAGAVYTELSTNAMSFRVSDHFPLWVEFETLTEEEMHERIGQPPVRSVPQEPAVEPDTPVVLPDGKPIATFLHSDRWTLDDQLDYSLYSKAIVEFLYHQDTVPPLTVGILAPWGQGKTTLMRLIQYHLWLKVLNEKLKSGETLRDQGLEAFLEREEQGGLRLPDNDKTKAAFIEKHAQKPPGKPEATFSNLKSSLIDPLKDLKLRKMDYPTVWFNAWKYQSSEQIWAGLAHAILSQLVHQIPEPLEREKFWLALQYERLDTTAIRRDIHEAVLERFLPKAVQWGVLAVLGLLATIFGTIGAIGSAFQQVWALPGLGFFTMLGALVPILRGWHKAAADFDKSQLEGSFARYVRQPNYEGKAGYFHEVEQDVRKVFNLLVSEGKPAVVFIDDLDRCNPGKVAEVIEAVNLFLSGDFPNCYFILGMDAQVVAASMDVAYEDLTAKLSNVTRTYGSLGWYFMDKFIQLQFVIPNISDQQRTGYLGYLFHQEALVKEGMDSEESAAQLDEAEDEIEEIIQKKAAPDEMSEHNTHSLELLRRDNPEVYNRLSLQLIEMQAETLADDNEKILQYLSEFEPYLGTSPRTMKRFANLYRFYGLTQFSRKIARLEAAPLSSIPRWLVIMLRWPQLVRWIQWEGEVRIFGESQLSAERAEAISKKVQSCDTFEMWIDEIRKSGAETVPWLADREMYRFLKEIEDDQESLGYAVSVGAW